MAIYYKHEDGRLLNVADDWDEAQWLIDSGELDGTNLIERFDPVIIVSVGHSGSSAFTQILVELGLYVGEQKDLIRNAARCLYEHKWHNEINQILIRGGKPRVKEILRFDRIWGFKNPRNCATFRFWHKVYPDSKWLFFERDEKNIRLGYPSVQKGTVDEAVTRRIKAYNKAKEYVKSNCLDFYISHYDYLTNNFKQEVEVIADWIGLKVTDDDLERVRELWRPKYDGKVIA